MFILRLGAEALSLADAVIPEKVFIRQVPPGNQYQESSTGTENQFLYGLLSGQEDATSAQSRSQLIQHNETSLECFPQPKNRSNSLVIITPQETQIYRSSSVPSIPPPLPHSMTNDTTYNSQRSHKNQPRRHHPYFAVTSNAGIRFSRCNSPNSSLSTDSGVGEAVDLTRQILTLANIYCGPDTTQSPELQINDTPQMQSSSYTGVPPFRSGLVHLAKKTQHPVQCHITDWLRKMITFVKSPLCSPLDQVSLQLRLRLLLASWHQLLALYMAETNFHAVVTSTMTSYNQEISSHSSNKQNTAVPQLFVDDIHNVIDLCTNMQFDASAYDQLRFVVLLIGGKQNLDATDAKLLENYLPSDRFSIERIQKIIMRLSQIDQKCMEILFCGHINVSVEEYIQMAFSNLTL